jgi:hypothetical protein
MILNIIVGKYATIKLRRYSHSFSPFLEACKKLLAILWGDLNITE